MNAETQTLDRTADKQAQPRDPRQPTAAIRRPSEAAAAEGSPDRSTAFQARHGATGNATGGEEIIDYWEEVALSRLRLAQWALIATLIASVLIALILG